MVYINPNAPVATIINEVAAMEKKLQGQKKALQKELEMEKMKSQKEISQLKQKSKSAVGSQSKPSIASGGRLKTDPLFLALTRPTMLLGVTYSWFSFEGFIWVIYFINTSNFAVVIPGAVVTHFIGFMLCSHEPRFMELVTSAAKTNMKCVNKVFHKNTSSYDLY